MSSCVSIEQRNPFMLQYISWPEFSLKEQKNYEYSCNTTEKSTINYATENAELSLCFMNIAKNHWVTVKCTVIAISLHLLVPVTF